MGFERKFRPVWHPSCSPLCYRRFFVCKFEKIIYYIGKYYEPFLTFAHSFLNSRRTHCIWNLDPDVSIKVSYIL